MVKSVKLRIKSPLLTLFILAWIGGVAALLTRDQLAPPATFASIKGEQIALESLRGKVVLVNFWATSCTVCLAEMPDLIETHRKYQPRGLETIAVAVSYDPPNYVLAYSEKKALPFIVAFDPMDKLAKAFNGVSGTPTMFVIDKQGKIVQQTTGAVDFVKLHRLIERELAAGA